ncbi:hypothetical protein SASPL_128817 [Salvia splendens]|uniref:Methyltransferase type 11 domain-containing protein n=1 Tax=Salvia splendens TaxID=180675 RepID=A0A8X8XDE0_SALSN|nr:EEF1A lysine methyltransferase 4-like isoform X1 [Salvia splendens]KAG6410749.1 hypothetical protein SASPL_128817 [Salvia splendens]
METSEAQKCDVAPATATAYLDPNYWDKRFDHEEHYEWFKDYSHFRHLILEYIKPKSAVLEVGCGNSQLCEELYRDGITDLTCIDLSSVAVEKMKQRLSTKGYKEVKVLEADVTILIYAFLFLLLSEVKVLEADMLQLPFEDECFDVVIEKGTMDVLFVDSGDPWNPEPETVSRVMAMLEGIHRVLKPNGIFISITFGQPHFRRPFFSAPAFTWSTEWKTFGDGFHYFFYILKKGERSSDGTECIEKTDVPSLSLYHEELESEDYLFRTNLDEM